MGAKAIKYLLLLLNVFSMDNFTPSLTLIHIKKLKCAYVVLFEKKVCLEKVSKNYKKKKLSISQ